MSNPVGLGFIGCGGHSRRHADVVACMPAYYNIVGAYDINPNTAYAFVSQYNSSARATDNLKTFLGIKELEAVLIGTPHKFHLELCQSALAAGKHILCEKPLWEGPRTKEGKQMLLSATKNKLVFSSCHLRRFEKEYMYVRDKLPDFLKRFGNALEVRFQFFYHEPSTDWKMSDSLLLDHMNHEIDLVHFLFGYAPSTFWRLSHGFDEYRVAGKTASGLAIWFSGYRKLKSCVFRNELEVVFKTGRVRVEAVLDSLTGLVTSVVNTLSFESATEEAVQFPPHPYNDSLRGVMENFAAAIRNKEKSYLTPEELLRNTTICNDLIVHEFGSI